MALRDDFASGAEPGWYEYDYRQYREMGHGWSFASLIMAAYYKADSKNAAKIGQAWPEIVAEFDARYNAPGGLLPGEGSTD